MVGGGGGGSVRRGFCENSKRIFFFWGGGLGGRVGGEGGGQVGGSGWWGVRVDVNAMLGVGGDVGYRGCEPRIEGIVQRTKRYCTILRKLKKCGGGGGGQYLNPKHSLCI